MHPFCKRLALLPIPLISTADNQMPDPDIDLADNDSIPLGDDDAAPGGHTNPEVRDNYVFSKIMFPRNGKMTKGCVVGRKRDAESNPIGWAHLNPVLDTRLYLMEFDDGDITELMANAIAESIYSQCNTNGNMYLLLDTFVDFWKMDKTISLDK